MRALDGRGQAAKEITGLRGWESNVSDDYDQAREDRFFRETFTRLKAVARIMLKRLGREVDVTEDDLAQEGALVGLRHLKSAWATRGYPFVPALLEGLEREASAVAMTAMKRDYLDLARRDARHGSLNQQVMLLNGTGSPKPEDTSTARQELARIRDASASNPDYEALYEASKKLGDATPDEVSDAAGVPRIKYYRWRDAMNRRVRGR